MDHEPEPPAPAKWGQGLLKPVNPDDQTFGGPVVPLQPDPAPTAPTMGSVQDTLSQFSFQYKAGGTTYMAQITHSKATGYSITLNKWTGTNWVPSTSRLKHALLASFIVQQAAAQAMAPQSEDEAEAKVSVQG